ncbi:hypothetical protein RhiirA1_450444 [Rhizophagus irregularis]|uniref:Uncharacterized protein n=4 Tax=Rhizophagus irregularis TaxID=588596 RepID=U9SG88_RHIID|nr:hypothetical protein GLOIN_2v1470512 [Rhizophagus irregularis DAOM 181602=DAOM 197198]EXX69937.1 hypothetical protein RirG_091970 [Rhizophagus irregularis DAOM 197198w]PKC74061.1 hypothetical protein RhiirA1_450444 [Rhizophagus irregularis]POG81676.1 hypothetical protein GLOIN_2v1470512 [Rhizophagus irregularis DAOM 181602=DAOM 197198]GBC40177.1 hypothetical protein GLOIN_2v1470512 [Rhizophagus irregularis DAOM 181602=DAOM 197198]|eukprot:XP_025188542.1 hypothetical protein GLOIN_2v1470512 [Rhizophagus irregularis DAOM 181602=DAOM 197198]
MTSIFYSSLSKDLSSILYDSDDYNVIIKVGKDQNMKEFKAHSVILRARSPYFKSALSNKWITKKDDMILFNKPNIDPIVFELILKYIYTGEVDLTNLVCSDILGLLDASDELLLDELVEYLQIYMIEEHKQRVQQNLILVLNKFARYDILKNYCLDYFCENSQHFISSKHFILLDKDVLYSLLERNNLQTNEIDIWDSLIRWGIRQTPGLNDDRSQWNNENYDALKNTLNQFIPLIRFVEIPMNEFFNKVQPYKQIIPNNIYEEFENFYHNGILPKIMILPPRIGKFESKIINPKLMNIIVNWINNKDFYNITDPHYKFELIYRGSDDGIDNKTFKSKCNGRIASLVLVKVQDSDKIFGGYSSIGFSSLGNDYSIVYGYGLRKYNAIGNFIFSFENENDDQNMKISRVINNSDAILDHFDSGFNFGQGSLCMIEQNLHVNNISRNYENNISTDLVYVIEEIETFIILLRE